MRERWLKLPPLFRFLIVHTANGMAIGSGVLLFAIWLDVGGIAGILASDGSGLATFILFFQNALTFGAVSVAVAVLAEAE